MTAESHAPLRAGGPDAAIGVDDWALSNGTLCAGVSDPTHESDLAPTGGTRMDLGHCGRGDDQFLIFEQRLDLSTRTLVPISRVTAESDASEARLVTYGMRAGLELETRHAVDLAEPTRLRIRSRIERESEVEGSADATYAALLPGFTPFAFSNPIFVDPDGDGSWTPPGLP